MTLAHGHAPFEKGMHRHETANQNIGAGSKRRKGAFGGTRGIAAASERAIWALRSKRSKRRWAARSKEVDPA